MRKSVVKNIFVVSFVSVLIKILGFIFRIYLSNVIGSEGIGLYHLILSVYALGATFSTVGISTVMSRLVAMNENNAKKILREGISITLFLGIAISIFVYFNCEKICMSFLRDERCILSVKIIAFAFPAISFFAALSGYFNGISKMKYPMYGQMIEQITRIIFVALFIKRSADYGLAYALNITTLGILLGEYISLLYLYLKYRLSFYNKYSVFTKKRFSMEIIKMAVPLSISNISQSILHTVESFLIPILLVSYGFSHNKSVGVFGLIKGMAMPLILFPTFFLNSVAIVSVPGISKAQSVNNNKQIYSTMSKSFLVSIVLGFSFMGLFLMFGEKICLLIYKNKEAGMILCRLAPVIPAFYLNITANGVLNGMGKQHLIMFTGIAGGLIQLGMIYILIPEFGVNGYIASFLFCEYIISVFNLIIIFKRKNYRSC